MKVNNLGSPTSILSPAWVGLGETAFCKDRHMHNYKEKLYRHGLTRANLVKNICDQYGLLNVFPVSLYHIAILN